MDDSGLSPVIVKTWLPKDALPVPEEGEEAPTRKPLEILLELIPERLKASTPFTTIKALEATIAANKAKLEAGEITEEEYDAAPEEELAGAMVGTPSCLQDSFTRNTFIYDIYYFVVYILKLM